MNKNILAIFSVVIIFLVISSTVVGAISTSYSKSISYNVSDVTYSNLNNDLENNQGSSLSNYASNSVQNASLYRILNTSSPGYFAGVTGVAIDGNKVFIADFFNQRIQVFSTNGSFLYSFNVSFYQWPQGFRPVSIAIDKAHHLIYLGGSEDYTDSYYNGTTLVYPNIKVYTEDGKFLKGLVINCGVGAVILATDKYGYIYEVENCFGVGIIKLSTNGTIVKRFGSDSGGYYLGVTVYGNYVYAVRQTNNPCNESIVIQAIKNNDTGMIAGRCAVEKYTLNGTLVEAWGNSTSFGGPFTVPTGIGFDGNYVYVPQDGKVLIFKDNGNGTVGTLVKVLGGIGNGPDQFLIYNPYYLNNGVYELTHQQIDIDNNSNIYITDYGNDRVKVYNSTFNLIRIFGGKPTLFAVYNDFPMYVDSEGYIYVVDKDLLGNLRVTKIDNSGNLLFRTYLNITNSPSIFLIRPLEDLVVYNNTFILNMWWTNGWGYYRGIISYNYTGGRVAYYFPKAWLDGLAIDGNGTVYTLQLAPDLILGLNAKLNKILYNITIPNSVEMFGSGGFTVSQQGDIYILGNIGNGHNSIFVYSNKGFQEYYIQEPNNLLFYSISVSSGGVEYLSGDSYILNDNKTGSTIFEYVGSFLFSNDTLPVNFIAHDNFFFDLHFGNNYLYAVKYMNKNPYPASIYIIKPKLISSVIAGKVVDNNGNAIVGATIRDVGVFGVEHETKTDSNGFYNLVTFSGYNEILAWSQNYAPQVKILNTTTGAIVNFNLTPINQFNLSFAFSSVHPYPLRIDGGVTSRQAFTISNLGNIGAYFIYLFSAPPYIILKGATSDLPMKIIVLSNNSAIVSFYLEPYQQIHLFLIYEGNYSAIVSLGLVHQVVLGNVPTQLAMLPPNLWNNLTSENLTVASFVNKAINMSINYEENLFHYLLNLPIDQINATFNNLFNNTPRLGIYVAYSLIQRELIFPVENYTLNELYSSNSTLIMNQSPKNGNESLYSLYTNSLNSLSSYSSLFPNQAQNSLQPLQSYQAGEGESAPSDESLLYKIICSPLFKFSVGVPAGFLQNMLFNLVNFTGDDAYFNAGKKAGNELAIIVSLLSVALGISDLFKCLASDTCGLKLIIPAIKKGWTAFREGAYGVSSYITILGKRIPAGIEEIVGYTENGEPIWGNIIKIAKNERGWYLGIDSVPGQTTTLENGKVIEKGFYHYYFNGKTAIWSKSMNTYEESKAPSLARLVAYLYSVPVLAHNIWNAISPLRKYWDEVFKTHNIPIPLVGSSTCGSNIGEARVAGDPNYMNVDPLNYTNGNLTNLFTVGFENEPNATLPAFNITVIIHLDPHYNSSTVKFQAASNITALSSFTVNKTNNVIVAQFTNISLPPDNPPPIGQGFISFSANVRNDTPPGTELVSYADVIFNNNPPVRTNNVTQIYDPLPPVTKITSSKITSGIVYINGQATDNISGVIQTNFFLVDNTYHTFSYFNITYNNIVKGTVNFTIALPVHANSNYTLFVYSINNAGVAENQTPFQFITPSGYKVVFIEKGLPPGTLWFISINGTLHHFVNSTVTLYFSNGSYTFNILPIEGYSVNPSSGSFTINGNNLTITIDFQKLFNVTFVEKGLPNGTLWKVTLNGITMNSTTNTILFSLPNGTYSYSIPNVSGLVANPSSGTIVVSGNNVTITVQFTLQTFTVTFVEQGLPSGTTWNVTLNGMTKSSSTNTITFQLPNGVYYYTVSNLTNYVAIPSSGTVIVSNDNVYVTIIFKLKTYPVTFIEQGLSNNTKWGVIINGTIRYSTSSNITFYLPNGKYGFTVINLTNYQINPISGTITVNSSSLTIIIHFMKLYSVTFEEQGLPSNTEWGVILNGTSKNTTSSFITFSLPSGSYKFYVINVTNYVANPSMGSFTITNSNITISINFKLKTFTVIFIENGLPHGLSWSVSVNGTIKSSNTSNIEFVLPNGKYSFNINTVNYYVPNPYKGNFNVNNNNLTIMIQFSLQTFNVTFVEQGLPAGTNWSILVNGTKYSSTNNLITIKLHNGTYEFHVLNITNYIAMPNNGIITVKGSNITVEIKFALLMYKVNFASQGLQNGTQWGVIINGTIRYSTSSNITFYLPNGKYGFTVINLTNYQINPISGTITVNSSSLTITISFTQLYPVVFKISGLPSNSTWSVTINGVTKTSSSDTIVFNLPKGNYNYNITLPQDYTVSNLTGSLNVSNQNVNIVLQASSTSNMNIYTAILIISVIAIVAVATYIIIKRK